MGDRGNIFVQESVVDGKRIGVWLYSHWGGYSLPLVLQRAMRRQQRWGDGSYLARIIFDEMTKGHVGEETGHGISARITDNEHSILVVNIDAKKVEVMKQPDWKTEADTALSGEPIATFTFSHFIELPIVADDWSALGVER